MSSIFRFLVKGYRAGVYVTMASLDGAAIRLFNCRPEAPTTVALDKECLVKLLHSLGDVAVIMSGQRSAITSDLHMAEPCCVLMVFILPRCIALHLCTLHIPVDWYRLHSLSRAANARCVRLHV